MRFEIVIRSGLQELAHIVGAQEVQNATVEELEKVIEVEQFLERLLGLRIHLNEVHRSA